MGLGKMVEIMFPIQRKGEKRFFSSFAYYFVDLK